MDRLVAGIVRSAFGVKGALKVESVSGELEHLLKVKAVTLRLPQSSRGQNALRADASHADAGRADNAAVQPPAEQRHAEKPATVEREFTVEHVRRHSRLLVMKLEGIDSVERARAWRGAELLVPRELAAPLKEEEYYIADLVGCVVYCNGEALGKVVSVWNSGPYDMLEVDTEAGIRHIPFRDGFIGTVDTRRGYIALITEWLLE